MMANTELNVTTHEKTLGFIVGQNFKELARLFEEMNACERVDFKNYCESEAHSHFYEYIRLAHTLNAKKPELVSDFRKATLYLSLQLHDLDYAIFTKFDIVPIAHLLTFILEIRIHQDMPVFGLEKKALINAQCAGYFEQAICRLQEANEKAKAFEIAQIMRIKLVGLEESLSEENESDDSITAWIDVFDNHIFDYLFENNDWCSFKIDNRFRKSVGWRISRFSKRGRFLQKIAKNSGLI